MTHTRAHMIAIQAIKANIAHFKRLSGNAKTRRDFAKYKRLQQYWELELEKITLQHKEHTL